MTPDEVEQLIVSTWDFDDVHASYADLSRAVETAGPDTPEGLALRTQLARAEGLQGSFPTADVTLDAVEADLQRLLPALTDAQVHHLRARLAIERGRVLNSTGSPEASRPLFETAYDEAAAADLAGLAVDALHMSAIAVGRTDGPSAASAINAQAISVAESSDDPAARRWLGSLLNNHGWDLHDAGSFEDALAVFRRAVEIRQEFGTHRELEVARWCVGRCLRSLERYSEALEIQEQLASTAAGAEDGYVYEEIGENLLALGRADEASPYFSRAHELLSDDDWLVDNESERLDRLATLAED